MLWPKLSPERSCVRCRSRRRLGRLRASTRVAPQSRSRSLSLSERTEKPPLAAASYCATGIDLFGNPASPVFSPAPGPIRTARNGLSAVGRYGHGQTSRLPLGPLPLPIERPRPWSARSAIRRFRLLRANSGRSPGGRTIGSNRPTADSQTGLMNFCSASGSGLRLKRSHCERVGDLLRGSPMRSILADR